MVSDADDTSGHCPQHESDGEEESTCFRREMARCQYELVGATHGDARLEEIVKTAIDRAIQEMDMHRRQQRIQRDNSSKRFRRRHECHRHPKRNKKS